MAETVITGRVPMNTQIAKDLADQNIELEALSKENEDLKRHLGEALAEIDRLNGKK